MKVLTGREIWPEISRLASGARPGTRRVAVPYVGADAHDRLKLGKGDRLVADCRPATASAGSTSPTALRTYLAAGVDVRRWEWLHAKVYVFGDVAVVGSANATSNSETNLDEAAVVLTSKRDVAAARAFVDGLCDGAAEVNDDWLDQCVAAWRPPRDRRPPNPRDGWSPIPEGDAWNLWVVTTEMWDPPAYVEEAAQQHRRSVRSRQPGPFKIVTMTWDGRPPFKQGDVIVEVRSQKSGRTTVYAPSQVEATWTAKRGRSSMPLVSMLRPNGLSAVSRGRLDAAISGVGWNLREVRAQRATTTERKRAILELWPELESLKG